MPQHERRHSFILRLLAVGFLAGAALTASSAQAASGVGPYFPEPAWDRKLPASLRFLVLTNWNNEAVLDKETGLVWERSPAQTGSWSAARSQCTALTTGGRRGWRLPSFHELQSLIQPNVVAPGPILPVGHPFINVTPTVYWSATIDAAHPNAAWYADFAANVVGSADVSGNMGIWCVRGGLYTDTY
jgi:uncharacterized protein DUF1566